jgi:hypothetical protein
MGFFALLPGVRRGLARELILEWEIIGNALDDVCPIKNFLSKSGGYYFLIGNRAEAAIIDTYLDGLLPMKPGHAIGNPYLAQRYVKSVRRLPDFIDRSLCIVPDSSGEHGVKQRFNDRGSNLGN